MRGGAPSDVSRPSSGIDDPTSVDVGLTNGAIQ
ncbi:hypothetical protein QFZ29_001076 [Agromyces albus]|nr:hypothetical protein [Agromyces albus]